MSKPVKVLIADDPDIVLDGLKSILNPFATESGAAPVNADVHPFQIVGVADSGEAALALLRESAFDLAIVDLHLGTHIDGLRVLEGIRWRWPQMAVIILTAHGSLESAIAETKQRLDGKRPVHCPSLSRSAGTWTWSAL